VLVFDRTGKIIRTIGSRGSGPGKLLAPSALAISAGGTLYVADTGNGRIVRFTVSGTHLGSFGRFRSIRGLAVSPDGARVYGADAATNRITVSTASGGDLAEIGATGSEPGELRTPGGLAVDGVGNLWVADRGNNRIQSFTADGAPLARFGERGVGAGQFVEPTGVAVDCHGLVTVTDSDNNRVQQFQFAPASACAALPAVQNPPDPILYNQPDPLPPEVTVKATRSSALFAIRQFPLRVSCDLPCKVAVTVALKPRSGKKRPTVTLRLTQSLPAGKTVTVRPRLSTAGVRTLKRAMGSRRGLVAEVRVVATTTDSAPTAVTQRLNVTG
jgi:DNA-binding beta-propeller fold protein YncE